LTCTNSDLAGIYVSEYILDFMQFYFIQKYCVRSCSSSNVTVQIFYELMIFNVSSNPPTGGIKVKTHICIRDTAITTEPMKINTYRTSS